MLILLLATLSWAKPVASSFAQDADGKYGPELALDGLLETGWGEGGMGHGDGSWWEFDLPTATKLDSLAIWPGNLEQGARSFREYARPKVVRVLVDGAQQGETIRLLDEMQRLDVPLDVTGKKVRVEVVEAYEGAVFSDLYIAEVAVNFSEGERTKAVEKVEAWRTGKEGAKLQAKHEEEVIAAWELHTKDTDENPGLEFLMSAAGDGPTYLRKKVGSLVSEGYRAAAIVPDPKAMDALRKLKDPNGIPGLEMAGLRALGKQQKEIKEVVEMFYAYAELLGGGRRNIKAWAEPGWEVGALRSFGEPLAVEIDRFGQLYIADTGNNRVQRFTQDGLSDKQWGVARDVSNAWFTGRRRWYAAGAAPSEEQGGFMNPVDVVLLPDKEADRFAALDAKGRIQIFDTDGNAQIGWTVRGENDIEPGVGGEGYLAWVPKKKHLVAFMGNTAVVYTLDSEEVTRWKIKDGTPNAVEAYSDGRLYLTFGSEIISYNTDGFRYGTAITDQILGKGFEDVDVTVDEEGRMWVLNDKGWIFKFKKPGKLDWKLKVSEIELERPRFCVSQGMVFITDRERIIKVDALQMHTDEIERKKEEAAAAGAEKKKK